MHTHTPVYAHLDVGIHIHLHKHLHTHHTNTRTDNHTPPCIYTYTHDTGVRHGNRRPQQKHVCQVPLQHTATHCSILQHTATHCNTLQYTATHCNMTNIYGTQSTSTRAHAFLTLSLMPGRRVAEVCVWGGGGKSYVGSRKNHNLLACFIQDLDVTFVFPF